MLKCELVHREFYDPNARPFYAILLAAMVFGFPIIRENKQAKAIRQFRHQWLRKKRTWNGVGFVSAAPRAIAA
jgi:hypothetical protein